MKTGKNREVHKRTLIISFFFPTNRKASIYRDGIDLDEANDNGGEDGGQIRYYFPKGCKGIDVLIDNSSRLRALTNPVDDQIARLPVTLKPTTPDSYVHSTPPSSYIPPGPLNIYRPDQIIYTTTTSSTPANLYLPANEPPNTYLPPLVKPSHIFLPPKEATTVPPRSSSFAYITQQITKKPPIAAYLSSPADISSVHRSPKPSVVDCSCCDEKSSNAKLIVPFPLKSGTLGKLVLPLSSFDAESKAKLMKLTLETDHIDVAKLIGIVLKD